MMKKLLARALEPRVIIHEMPVQGDMTKDVEKGSRRKHYHKATGLICSIWGEGSKVGFASLTNLLHS
jgi:hypothetical protein